MQKMTKVSNKKHVAKKRKIMQPFQITNLILPNKFLKGLVLYIAKGYQLLSFIKNP